VSRELDAILASKVFANSGRLSRFLRYVVGQTLQGGGERLKEYQVGLDVFDRSGDYDPRTDPVVRVEARQLRFKLAEYYGGSGREDQVVISLPKGGYMVRFEWQGAKGAEETPAQSGAAAPSGAPVLEPSAPGQPKRWLAVAAWVVAAVVVVSAVGIWAYARPRRPSVPAANPDAQQLYLKGRYYWNKRTPESLNAAVDNFTQAIARDPGYAAAYVGLADAYNLLSEYTVMPYREAFARSVAAASKAVQLDDSSAEAHCSLAYALFWGNWDTVSAEREFRRALQLKPDYVVAHHWFATALSIQGRFDEASAQIDRAEQLDPSSTSILADKSMILYNGGQHQQAIALATQVAGSDPSFLSAHNYLAQFYLNGGDYPGYLRELRTAALLEHDLLLTEMVSEGEKAFQTSGGRGMLEAMLRVQQKRSTGLPHNYELARTCILLEQKNKALEYLKAALDKRETNMLGLRIDPYFKSLRGDARFEKIVADVGPSTLP
jgi:tetratricopeptide (TPR) repeat protein